MKRDLRAVLIAVALLLASGSLWLWSSSRARERREQALAGVPAFPAPGQRLERRPVPPGQKPPPPMPRPAPPPPAGPARAADPMTSFVLAPAPSVAMVSVNALLNTPLFEKVKECLPLRYESFVEQARSVGVDLERDVDRVATIDGGAAMSGFFEGKDVAGALASRFGPDVRTHTHRGVTVHSGPGAAVAQSRNLIVFGDPARIDAMLDRALDPPTGGDPAEVYGDVYVRSDLSGVRAAAGRENESVQALLDQLAGVTVRANVWDSVALTVEGKPRGGMSAQELARMARGAIALVRKQIAQDDVEVAALAELAKVEAGKDGLQVDLALPAKDLFERLKIPCPGRDRFKARQRFPR